MMLSCLNTRTVSGIRLLGGCAANAQFPKGLSRGSVGDRPPAREILAPKKSLTGSAILTYDLAANQSSASYDCTANKTSKPSLTASRFLLLPQHGPYHDSGLVQDTEIRCFITFVFQQSIAFCDAVTYSPIVLPLISVLSCS